MATNQKEKNLKASWSREFILNFIRDRGGFCTTPDLHQRLPASTVCRWLDKLEASGEIKRVHGFVCLADHQPSGVVTLGEAKEILGFTKREIHYLISRGTFPKTQRAYIAWFNSAELLASLNRVRVGEPITVFPREMVRQKDLKKKYGLTGIMISRWMRSGLPYFRFERAVLFDADEAVEYIKRYTPITKQWRSRALSEKIKARFCQA